MQVRRLITVLNKMIEENPSLAYAKVGVFSEAFKSDYYAVKGFNEQDLGVELIEWDDGRECENRQPQQILVFGVDQYRIKFGE